MKQKSKEVVIPLKLRDFEVVSDNTTKKAVIRDLREILDFVYKEQELLYNSDERYNLVCDRIRNSKKHSANTVARYMGLRTSVEYPYQKYNINYVFGSIVVNKSYGYIQSDNLFAILKSTNLTDIAEIRNWYKNAYKTKAPIKAVIKAHLHRFYNKGQTEATKPAPSKEFPLSQADMNFCSKPEVKDGYIYFTLKLSKGKTTLKFKIPEKPRFTENVIKFSRPTLIVKKNRVVFVFSVFKHVEPKKYQNTVGVDVGKKEGFVATSKIANGEKYSTPFHTSRQVNVLTKRIDNLYKELKALDRKIEVSKQYRHFRTAEKLEIERSRKRDKISAPKEKRAELEANQIVEIAHETGSGIALEDLTWVGGKSGTWERSLKQRKITDLARSNGIEVKKVSAKNTSQECPNCGGKVTHNTKTRKTTCRECQKRLDRDVLASRNIAERGRQKRK